MLFFVNGRMRKDLQLPTEKYLKLVVREWEKISEYREKGFIVGGGAPSGQKGGCGIFDVPSNDDLHRLLTRLPMYAYVEWDIVPLSSIDAVLAMAQDDYNAYKERHIEK